MYPEILKIGPLTIYSYGLMAAIGFLLGGYLLERELARVGRKIRNKQVPASRRTEQP